MFRAPSAAGPDLTAVVRAEPPGLEHRWRTLIGAAAAAGALRADVDPRILALVLHRATLTAGQAWAWDNPSGTVGVADSMVALLLDGLATAERAYRDDTAAARAADAARARWAAQAARPRPAPSRPAPSRSAPPGLAQPRSPQSRDCRGAALEAARSQFALRGFEATTVRDIADAAGLTAGNLYRYFPSKDAMVAQILGDFSDQLLQAYRDVIGTGSAAVETVDAILWLLDLAGHHFRREIEILQPYTRLLALGVADRYQAGAQTRFALLVDVIDQGIAAGELRPVAEPELIATGLREILWAPMPDLAAVSPRRVREFYRQTVLAGAAVPR
jgi:AcrR family transcriptional regulator